MEGEGLNLAFARPWQVAWCLADNREIKDIQSHYIHWDSLRVSRGAAIKTRFNPDLYKQVARPAKDVLAEFDAVVYDPSTEIITQNGLGYDIYVHQNWRRECGKPPDWSYLLRSIDLTALSKALKKQWTPDISSPEAFLAWQYRCDAYIESGLKTRLETMGKEEKIEHDYTTLHEATSDIVLMMKVFWKRLYQVEF